VNRKRGNLRGGKCSRTLYLYNCLVDLTFSDSLNTQTCALALTHLKLMPHVKKTQGPKCLKERKRQPTGENNPQARTTFSFSGSPLSAAALKKIWRWTLWNLLHCRSTPTTGFQCLFTIFAYRCSNFSDR